MVHVSGTEHLLGLLAGRVRRLRRARGWSRPELARRSGLSTRFLARIESGDGNVSLLRLSELAQALGTTADALIRPGAERTSAVALVGLRGAGKSTVGPQVARRLGLSFVEMDARIVDAAGLPVEQIFEMHGEAYYRRIERQVLETILATDPASVIAVAGGVVTEPATWDLLLRRTTTVWLRARPEDHWARVVEQGDHRPMADQPDALAELRALLARREPLYARAHVVIDTSERTPEQVARDVVERLATVPERMPA